MGVGLKVGVPVERIQTALAQFSGVGRRFEVHGELDTSRGRVLLVDDYGHHPKEVAATLLAVKNAWPERRCVLVFQPHRYTRTHDLFEDFSMVLSGTDLLLLLEVYSAGEQKIAGADGRSLCRAIRTRGEVNPVFVERPEDLTEALLNVIEEGDVILTQGAGNVGSLSASLPGELVKER